MNKFEKDYRKLILNFESSEPKFKHYLKYRSKINIIVVIYYALFITFCFYNDYVKIGFLGLGLTIGILLNYIGITNRNIKKWKYLRSKIDWSKVHIEE